MDEPQLSAGEPVFSPSKFNVVEHNNQQDNQHGMSHSDESGQAPLRRSLQERRSHGSLSLNKPLGLCMDTIVANSRDSVVYPGETAERPAFRGWQTTLIGLSTPTAPQGITTMTYNILASRYTSTDKYPQCPTWALAETFRSRSIAAEVTSCDPDIVCFQEMSIDAYETDEMLGATLRNSGYESNHLPVTDKQGNACVSATSGETRLDTEGVAVFYRASRFELMECYPVRFNQLAMQDEKSRAIDEKQRARLQINSHNVALVMVLRDKISGVVYVVGTVHLYWDASRPLCQVWQLQKLAAAMEEMRETYEGMPAPVAALLLGDFNCEQSRPPMAYLLRRNFAEADMLGHAQSTSNPSFDGSECPLHLSSAYEEYLAENPRRVTAVNPSGGFHGLAIDHIFFQQDMLVCTAVGHLGAKCEMPNDTIPSDHYPLAASFIPTTFVQ